MNDLTIVTEYVNGDKRIALIDPVQFPTMAILELHIAWFNRNSINVAYLQKNGA